MSNAEQSPSRAEVLHVANQRLMRVPNELTPELAHRKKVRELLSCDTCGQMSHLKDGMWSVCTEKYDPAFL